MDKLYWGPTLNTEVTPWHKGIKLPLNTSPRERSHTQGAKRSDNDLGQGRAGRMGKGGLSHTNLRRTDRWPCWSMEEYRGYIIVT